MSIFDKIIDRIIIKVLFMDKLVLIDGNSLINRAFYAMPVLSTKDGVFTNAVYGFMNMFFKMQSDIKPTHVAVAFDLKAPTFRHKMYSEYKGTRKPMPEELRPQIPLLKEVLALMGVAIFEKEGFEADDIIGTIAKNTDVKTVIFTGDKDSFQLVDEQTEVHFTRRGITDTETYNHENFTEKTGLNPSQIIDLKALMGDSSDNIPGIAGVGEKTALSLLQTYVSVEGIYRRLDELKGKLKEKISEGRETCYLSKALATINTNCGVSTDLNDMIAPSVFSHKVKEKFIELEFKSLYQKQQLFSGENKEENQSQNIERKKLSNLDELDTLTDKTVAIVFLDSAVNFSDGKVEFIAPIYQNIFDDGFSLSEVLNKALKIINNSKKTILFSKKDFRHQIAGVSDVKSLDKIEDLSIIKYLTDFTGKVGGLTEVLTEYDLSLETPSASLLTLYNKLYNLLIEQDVEKLYREVELPLADVLFEMEQQGFKVDINALEELGEKYYLTLKGIEKEIRELANEPNLNVNSPKQLGDLIFDKLKLGKGKKTKSGYSTSAEVIESLEGTHPIITEILKYRKLSKLHSTYIEGLKPLIDKRTGLVKTSFNQTVTSTGRLSSKEPNLQNIPIRDEEGIKLRKFFVARENSHTLVSADYSQIELRLLAHFSGSKPLITAFKNEIDVHSITASKVFGVDIASVTPDMRRTAKAVNFGIIYGISEYGLAKNLKISPAKAKEYIVSYFKEYPEVKTYLDSLVEFARTNGYAKTLLNRRRYIAEIKSSNYMLKQFGERAAMNMPLQGSSADIIKLAMLKVNERLKREGLKSRLILQIHDELIIDALKTEKETVKKLLKEEMEGAVNLTVPLTVSVGEGERWFDAK